MVTSIRKAATNNISSRWFRKSRPADVDAYIYSGQCGLKVTRQDLLELGFDHEEIYG